MSEYHFQIDGQNQKIQIDPNAIYGIGAYENPALTIPLNLSLHPNTSNIRNIRPFNLLGIEANLHISGFNTKISNTVKFNFHKIKYQTGLSIPLEFPLDLGKICKIEEKRKDNLSISVSLLFHVGIYESVDGLGGKTEKYFVSDFEHYSVKLDVIIPQSQWVTKVLPELGYKEIRLIEIPSASTILVDELKHSLKELDIANEFFLKGDYDKTVAHCRTAIDPIKRKLPDLKKLIQSDTEKDWVTKVTTATDIWLDTIVKQTFAFTSKAHHIPSIGHFSRADAEIIYMITLGIVAYAGKLNPDKYKQKK